MHILEKPEALVRLNPHTATFKVWEKKKKDHCLAPCGYPPIQTLLGISLGGQRLYNVPKPL